MIPYLNFTLAIVLSLAITPAAIKLCILDKPNYRKIHDKSIPKGGGIGIFIPVLLLVLVNILFFKDCVALDHLKYFTIWLVTLILMITGIIDDKLELGSTIKLIVQIIVVLATLLSGIRFHIFRMEFLDLMLTGCWIIGIINAVNLIDGLDGLAAGIAVIASAGFGIIGYAYGDMTIPLMSLIIVGACLGFLRYNFRPARIFMGDTGSVPLGYHLAILGILCANVVPGRTSLIIPIMLVGIPIFDTLLTIIRRALNHKPIFQPDRSHFYNLIIDIKGVDHKKTVMLIYVLNVILMGFAVLLAFINPIIRIAVMLTVALAACLISKSMGFIKIDDTHN